MDQAFRQQPHTRAQGRLGEERAESWLRRRGYRIVERNASTAAGEIDVIAMEGDTLCFIEVKARSNRVFGPAVAAVPKAKQRRLARAAALYLAVHPTRGPCRFDVLAIDLRAGEWRFTLIRNAFTVPDR